MFIAKLGAVFALIAYVSASKTTVDERIDYMLAQVSLG